MRLISAGLFLIFVIFCASCSNGNIEENNSLQNTVKSPLYSVNGESCPVFEDDIFSLEGKKSFGECEIRKNPNLFKDKLLRVKSNYGFMIHGAYLSDKDDCPNLSKSIDEAISVEFRSDKDYDYIDKLNEIPISIIAVGKFTVNTPSNNSDTIYDRTPYHFEVICLEKAEKLNK